MQKQASYCHSKREVQQALVYQLSRSSLLPVEVYRTAATVEIYKYKPCMIKGHSCATKRCLFHHSKDIMGPSRLAQAMVGKRFAIGWL